MPSPPPTLRPTDTLRRTDQQVSCELDGEAVLLSIANGHYYHFNAVASRIWDLTAAPTTSHAIVNMLLQQYAVDRLTCEREVASVLGEMLGVSLIEVAG